MCWWNKFSNGVVKYMWRQFKDDCADIGLNMTATPSTTSLTTLVPPSTSSPGRRYTSSPPLYNPPEHDVMVAWPPNQPPTPLLVSHTLFQPCTESQAEQHELYRYTAGSNICVASSFSFSSGEPTIQYTSFLASTNPWVFKIRCCRSFLLTLTQLKQCYRD